MQPKDVHSKNPAIMRGSQKAPLKGARWEKSGFILQPLIGTAIYFHLTKDRAKKTEEQAIDNLWLELPRRFIGMKRKIVIVLQVFWKFMCSDTILRNFVDG